jgi:hypothetical protein
MVIGYVIRDARKWEVDPERTASKFDDVYYRGLLQKAWTEISFLFKFSRVKIGRSLTLSVILQLLAIGYWPEAASSHEALDDQTPETIKISVN